MLKKILLLRGGLGNQLFIFGAYKYFSYNGIKCFIDDSYGFENDFVYKRTNSLVKFDFIYNRLNFNISLIWKLFNYFIKDSDFFFFSNRYYQEAKFLDYININFNVNIDRICIHIRIKNYPLKLDESDYLKMIKKSTTLYPGYPIYLLTDDINYLKDNMKILSEFGHCLELSELDAFNFIAESSVTILSDSSFSFCSAYLGKDKVIFYSRFTNILNNGLKKHKWINY